MDGPGENEPDLIPASHPRFCEAIKTDTPPYSTLFSRVFKNKTFHVYKLKKLKKKTKLKASPTFTGWLNAPSGMFNECVIVA
ncbi:putative C-mannosyltransferase DPY19L3, partial [Pimephales promelas]